MSESGGSGGASKSDLEFARRQLSKARTILDQVKNHPGTEDFDISNNPGAGVFAGRESIELSVKAMLKSAGINSPEEHAIDLEYDRIQGIVHDVDIPNQLYKDVLRSIFLTTSWKPYYEPARYGIRERNIPAGDFISEIDVKRAISDAEFCLETADSFYEYQMEQNGYELSDLDLS